MRKHREANSHSSKQQSAALSCVLMIRLQTQNTQPPLSVGTDMYLTSVVSFVIIQYASSDGHLMSSSDDSGFSKS